MLTLAYVIGAWAAARATGGPSEDTVGLVASVTVLGVFIGLVALRGRQVGDVVGVVIGTTALLSLLTSIVTIPQPARSLLAFLLPLVVYAACDRDDGSGSVEGT